MRSLVLTSLLLLAFCLCANAQSSDTLVINIKNNQVEKIAVSQIRLIQFENLTSVLDGTQPAQTNLSVKGNYPNPIVDKTDIEFDIISAGNVTILIFDARGNQIQSLNCDNCTPGKNTLIWNCMDKNNNRVQNGTYFYEVRFGNEIQTRRMIVIK